MFVGNWMWMYGGINADCVAPAMVQSYSCSSYLSFSFFSLI